MSALFHLADVSFLQPDTYEQIMRVNSLLVQCVSVEFVLFLVGCWFVAKHEVIELNTIQYSEKHSILSLSFMYGFKGVARGGR